MANKKHNGYVIIMLLVVIAIGLLIYFMDIMAISGGDKLLKTEKPEKKVWDNEALIKDQNHPIRAPKPAANSPKPVISKPLALKADVTSAGAKRGQIVFTIQPDSTLAGEWQCQYSYPHAAYVMTASFKGNTDIKQTFPGNPAKLYFIASGEYSQKATNLENGEITDDKGTVYVEGWLNTDFSASGKLSITTNKRWHADYTWQTEP